MATTEPPEPEFYKQPDAKVRPGDIVRLSPAFRALKEMTHVGQEQPKPGRVTAELLGRSNGAPAPAHVLNGTRDTKFVVPGKLEFAILLTRGCDIDHGKVRQLAAIKPLSTVQGVENQAAVIEGRHTSLHFLPAAPGHFDRSYVDFRYIVTIGQELFDTLDRPLAVTRDALMVLYFGWMRHTTGRDIPQTLDCTACNHPIEVFQEIAEIVNPEDDY
jgi:hypothetical protein